MSRIAALLAAFALAGCATHQQFTPLDPARMAPSDRVQTFMRLRPVQRTTTIENGNNPIDSSIILDDKTEVFLPEDLAPLVGENSETMRAARQSMTARTNGTIAWVVTLGVLVGGVVMSVRSDEGLGGWSAATLGGVLVGGVVVRHYNREDIDARRRAFAAYPRELGATLNVCAHGFQVVPCEGPLPPP